MRLIDADKMKEDLLTVNPIYKNMIQWCMRILDAQPTVEPKRKRGRWIEDDETFYKAVNEKGGGVNWDTPFFTDDIACSECLALFSVIDNCTERFDFCPHCGADMGGDNVHVSKKDADYTGDIYTANWIDIYSDLPDEPGEYLLTVEGRQSGRRWVDKVYFNGTSFDHYYLAKPVAWAEMPEPYQR